MYSFYIFFNFLNVQFVPVLVLAVCVSDILKDDVYALMLGLYYPASRGLSYRFFVGI